MIELVNRATRSTRKLRSCGAAPARRIEHRFFKTALLTPLLSHIVRRSYVHHQSL